MKSTAKTKVGGIFTFALKRDGQIIEKVHAKNIVVDEALKYYQETALNNGTAKPTWYLGLFKGTRTPEATDTGTTISALQEELTTEYSETNRVTWIVNAVVDNNIGNNDAPASFNMVVGETVTGAMLMSENTKGGSVAGTILMAAAKFSSARVVISGDEIILTYELTMTNQ